MNAIKTLIPSNPKFVRQLDKDIPYLQVSEFFSHTIQGEGINIGKPAVFLRMQSCTMNCVWCFHKNTKIQTLNNGKQKIQDIKEGDVLLTLDEKNGIVQTTVKKTMNRQANIRNDMVKVICDSDTLYVTKEHPIFVKDKGWTPAGQVEKGDVILSVTGKQVVSYKMKTNNPMQNEESAEKMSKTMQDKYASGEIIPYERTEKHKRLMALTKTGEQNPMKRHEVRKKNTLSHNYPVSNLEMNFIQVFEKHGLPITFTNSKVAIGNNRTGYHFPDFVVDGKQKVIEVYDSSFPLYVDGKRTEANYEEPLRQHYEKFGFSVLFLTENDLCPEGLQKVIEFVFNGSVVQEVSTEYKNAEFVSLFGNLQTTETTVYNLECAPYNSYLANNMLVHNCDTASVWRQGNPYSFEELFELMEQHKTIDFLRDGASLVLTGGSPLLQQKELADFLYAFFDKYDFMPYVEVENECTLVPNELIPYVSCWNNSPKLSNSGNVPQLRYKPDVLKQLNQLDHSWFKFVIRNENDWQEILEEFILPGCVSPERIILMPVGGSREELNKNAPTVVDIAIRNNVRYCSREHVQLWDTLTGV